MKQVSLTTSGCFISQRRLIHNSLELEKKNSSFHKSLQQMTARVYCHFIGDLFLVLK